MLIRDEHGSTAEASSRCPAVLPCSSRSSLHRTAVAPTTARFVVQTSARHGHPVSACTQEGSCTANSMAGYQAASSRCTFLRAYKR
jgi:hypothetical protein